MLTTQTAKFRVTFSRELSTNLDKTYSTFHYESIKLETEGFSFLGISVAIGELENHLCYRIILVIYY